MRGLNLAAAEVTATVLEVGLYGASPAVPFASSRSMLIQLPPPPRLLVSQGSYTLIFVTCIYIIRTKRIALHRLLSSAAIISYVLATVCIVINTYRMYRGYSIDRGDGARLTYEPSNGNAPLGHTKDYIFNVNVSLGPPRSLWTMIR